MPLHRPHFHAPSREYGLSQCHFLAFLPQLLASNFFDRIYRWIAAVGHLCGGDQTLLPGSSSSRGKRVVQWERALNVALISPSFPFSHFSFQSAVYFSKMSYLIPFQRHFLWVYKSGFHNCILTSLIFLTYTFLFSDSLAWLSTCMRLWCSKVHSSSWLWC